MMTCSDLMPILEEPVEKINLYTLAGKLLDIWITYPDKEAIVFYDSNNVRSSITNQHMMKVCQRFSSLVRSNGIRKGDVVCNLLPQGIEREVATFGLILAGVVVMDGMNLNDQKESFWEIINKAEVKGIVVEPHEEALGWKLVKQVATVGEVDTFIERYTGKNCPTLTKLFMFRLACTEYQEIRPPPLKPALEILAEGDGKWVDEIYSHDNAFIFVEMCPYQKYYKMITRTHQEVISMAERNVEMLRFLDNDIIYNDFPLSWLTRIPFSYIMKGCTMVKSTLFECQAKHVVNETWDLIERENCTMAALQPRMVQMLASHCYDFPESHWKLRAISTTYNIKDTALDAIGVVTSSIIICYSHIEVGIVTRLIVDKSNIADYRNGCVGNMNTNTVRTSFNGALPYTPTPGKVGEILVHGKLKCEGYFKDDVLTRSSFTKDGAFITGDVGYYDKNGMLYVLGRKADVILRQGQPMFPDDIETVINKCPGIWRVKVVLVRDVNGALQICACVIPRKKDELSTERVQEYCRKHFGAPEDKDEDTHRPTYIIFFESFPCMNGDIDKRLLTQDVSDIIHHTPSADETKAVETLPEAEED